MNLPNTTPTPNLIFNGEMKKMGDTEFRIVMIVVRATLGWELDSNTGMRKQEDWISYYQLKQKSGRGYTALAKAIQVCIKRGWIEARDKEGNLLDTKQKRIGKKIYYRLGKIFLDRITSSESEEVKKSTSSESVITESEAYKRNSLQKNKDIAKTSFASPSCKGKKEKKTNPAIPRLFEYFTKQTKIIVGFEPDIAFAKEGKLLLSFLKRFSENEAKDLIDFFLESKESKDLSCSLSIALSTFFINKWKEANL